jgi:hypothetical protein
VLHECDSALSGQCLLPHIDLQLPGVFVGRGEREKKTYGLEE